MRPLIAVLLIVLPACTPNLSRARMRASESAAISDIRTLTTAQVQYFSEYNAYAGSLAQLGPSPSGAPGKEAAALIPAALSSGEKNGFRFTVKSTAPSAYTITAVPVTPGTTGERTFFSDQTMTIRWATAPELATATSPEYGR